ncbi:unnamed protein product, partial [Amoebophrya sp. A25]|eukprot:GSA25T00016169001.1
MNPFLWFSSSMIFSGLLASVTPIRLVHATIAEATYSERESGMMDMQLVYGVQRSMYWSAHFVFWYLIFAPFQLVTAYMIVSYTESWTKPQYALGDHVMYAEGTVMACLPFVFPILGVLFVSATCTVEAPTREKFPRFDTRSRGVLRLGPPGAYASQYVGYGAANHWRPGRDYDDMSLDGSGRGESRRKCLVWNSRPRLRHNAHPNPRNADLLCGVVRLLWRTRPKNRRRKSRIYQR